MRDTIVLNAVFQQGIFASEQEMDQLEETKDSILNKIVTIPFGEDDAIRSMKQAIEEYLKDVAVNAKEYSSALNVMGIFSYAEDCPIENWLCNSVENLKGNAIELPTNWFDISELTNTKDWPLFYSLSMKRIEHERMYIPVEAFRFWEQKDFKELLTEVMDKSAFFKINPEEEKDQGIAYLFLEMFKIRRQINVSNMQPELASRFFNQKWQKPMTGYCFIKTYANLNATVSKKCLRKCQYLNVTTKLQQQHII